MCLHQWLSCPDFRQSLFSSKDLWSGDHIFVCTSKAILASKSLLSCCYWFGERVEETVLSLFFLTKSRGAEAVWIMAFLHICSVAEVGHIPAPRTVSSQAHREHTVKAAGIGLEKKPPNQTKKQNPTTNQNNTLLLPSPKKREYPGS